MLDLLAPLDYPRQATANFARGLGRLWDGSASTDDLIGMAPGAVGGLAAAVGGGPLMGALMGGLAQGAGKLSGLSAFNAPTAQDVTAAIGGDPESMWQTMGTQILTDPLTYPLGSMGMSAILRGRPAGAPLLMGKDDYALIGRFRNSFSPSLGDLDTRLGGVKPFPKEILPSMKATPDEFYSVGRDLVDQAGSLHIPYPDMLQEDWLQAMQMRSDLGKRMDLLASEEMRRQSIYPWASKSQLIETMHDFDRLGNANYYPDAFGDLLVARLKREGSPHSAMSKWVDLSNTPTIYSRSLSLPKWIDDSNLEGISGFIDDLTDEAYITPWLAEGVKNNQKLFQLADDQLKTLAGGHPLDWSLHSDYGTGYPRHLPQYGYLAPYSRGLTNILPGHLGSQLKGNLLPNFDWSTSRAIPPTEMSELLRRLADMGYPINDELASIGYWDNLFQKNYRHVNVIPTRTLSPRDTEILINRSILDYPYMGMPPDDALRPKILEV